jgi:hypothetical protein
VVVNRATTAQSHAHVTADVDNTRCCKQQTSMERCVLDVRNHCKRCVAMLQRVVRMRRALHAGCTLPATYKTLPAAVL